MRLINKSVWYLAMVWNYILLCSSDYVHLYIAAYTQLARQYAVLGAWLLIRLAGSQTSSSQHPELQLFHNIFLEVNFKNSVISRIGYVH